MARLIEWDDREFREFVARRVREDTDRVLDEARRTCPRRDGTLARSLRSEVNVSGPEVVGRVYTELEYAHYVHEGRGPIEARPGHALGPLPSPYPRFVRRVGPARGQPWLLEALRSAQPYPVREGG